VVSYVSFINYYIVPMCGALWSSSNASVLDSSAYSMIAFMDNHCMLQLFDRPQWKTVAGRSRWGQGQEATAACTLLYIPSCTRERACCGM
jgi:predicted NAD/FAD-binding protein